MSGNPRVAAVLTTEKRTPALSLWFRGLLVDLSAAAPVGSAEAAWSARERDFLESVIMEYKAHRKASDKQRPSSHQNLYRGFNDSVNRVVSSLNLKVNKKEHLSLPCDEVSLENSFRLLASAARWLYTCNGCGHQQRSTDDMWISEAACYCPPCRDRYTVECSGCQKRLAKSGLGGQNIVRDNDLHKECTVCGECTDKVKFKTSKCSACGHPYLGPPSGSSYDETITAKDILPAEVCYLCANDYERGDCGHVDVRLREVPLIENVEDDDRDREDVGRGYGRVCNKCQAAYEQRAGGEGDIQHWEAKNPSCKSKSYDEVGSKRSFGVEIEVCQVKNLKPMAESMKAYWSSKRDASLPEIGVEMASTILYGDSGLKVVRDLCEYAKKNDWRVDARAGLHLHVGLPSEPYNRLAAVAMGYHLTYDLWSSFVAPSRQRCKYCRKNSMSAASLYPKSPADILHAVLSDPSIEGRRCWVNWHSYTLHGTVEIRLHHCTLMYDKISNWIKAHTRFVDWCLEQGDHAKVYDVLAKKTVREQFLVITQAAWKDRALGRWYRERANVLFDGAAPLPDSNRQLRLRGIKPEGYKPGFNYQIGGKPVYVNRVQEQHYVICDQPAPLPGCRFVTPKGWHSDNGMRFLNRKAAVNFIKMASSQGMEAALASGLAGKAKTWKVKPMVVENTLAYGGMRFRRAVPTPRPVHPVHLYEVEEDG